MLPIEHLKIAMLSVHSCPIGKLGTKDTGGMSVYIRELARKLGQRGHQVDIYTRQRDSDHRPVMDLFENVRLIHLDIQANGNIFKAALYPYLPDFFRSLEHYRVNNNLAYDVIHSHYWLSGQLGNWAQELWQRPHLMMFHTLGAVKNSTGIGKKEPELRIATEKKIVQTCHRILAPTRREKERLLNDYAALSDKIGIVPCGVNFDRFSPLDKVAARKKLKLDPDDPVILFVGRFDPLKGLDRLLKAMTYLKHHHRLRLIIVGGDGNNAPESKRFRESALKLGIENQVVFAGRIDQGYLPTYYGAADAVVIPSYYESFGLVGLEALACGRPVISTAVGVMESLIAQNKVGILVRDPSPQYFAKAIESIFNGLLSCPADRIRKTVLGYNWSIVAAAVLKEYERVIAKTHVHGEEGCCRSLTTEAESRPRMIKSSRDGLEPIPKSEPCCTFCG
jgi:D-inositol-3-phosphate glycosyltransferase